MEETSERLISLRKSLERTLQAAKEENESEHSPHVHFAPSPPAAASPTVPTPPSPPAISPEVMSPPPTQQPPQTAEVTLFTPPAEGPSAGQRVLEFVKAPVFFAIITFLAMLTALAVTKVSIFGNDVPGEGNEDDDDNTTRQVNWKAVLVVSGLAAALVLVIPYIIQWRSRVAAKELNAQWIAQMQKAVGIAQQDAL